MKPNNQIILDYLIYQAVQKMPELYNVEAFHCEEADDEHRESIRQYMHVAEHFQDNSICYSKFTDELPPEFIVGLFAHELGHLALIAMGDEDHSEDDAHEMGGYLTGCPITLITWNGRKNLEWSPLPLDLVEHLS